MIGHWHSAPRWKFPGSVITWQLWASGQCLLLLSVVRLLLRCPEHLLQRRALQVLLCRPEYRLRHRALQALLEWVKHLSLPKGSLCPIHEICSMATLAKVCQRGSYQRCTNIRNRRISRSTCLGPPRSRLAFCFLFQRSLADLNWEVVQT